MSQNKLPGNTSLPSPDSVFEDMFRAISKKSKYSIEDFFRNPEQTDFQISPTGQYLSYMAPYKNRRNIVVKQVSSGEIKRITSETERDIAGYAWANDNRLIYIKDSGGDENFTLFGVDHDGKNHLNLTPYDKVVIQIIDPLRDQEDAMIIGMNKNNPMLFEPYRIDLHTGALVQLAENKDPSAPFDEWMTDNQGKLRVAIKLIGGVNKTIMYRDTEEEEFREVITTHFKDQLAVAHFDAEDSPVVYAASNIGRDKVVLTRLDLNTGKETGEIIFEHDEVDVGSIIWSRKRKKLLGVNYTTWKNEIHFFDKKRENLQKKWEKLIPNSEIIVAGTDRNEKIYVLRSYSDKSLGSYFLYKTTNDSLAKIADVSPWIDENDMSEMQAIEYQSSDGLTIHGYLSLPKTQSGDTIPFVVHPHGGPWVRDNWGYNPAVQMLTNNGYGVLQMNYRGSTGYGKAFWEKSFKQWGKTMQQDITDGVHWIISEGYADPKRIAIFGGSYGGYATLAGICFTPDLYRCAIDFVGVSNLFTFMLTIPPYWKPYLDMLQEMVGHPEKDKELLESASPIFHVNKIKTPLLVAQGANDPRVNIDESDQIVSTLRAKGIDVPYLVRYDEGHGFAKEENRFAFYRALLGFLNKHMS